MSKYKYVVRVLTLYLCVLVPMIFFSLLIAQSTYRQAEQREKQIMLRILQDVAGELDSWHTNFLSQTGTLGATQEFSPTTVLSDPGNGQQVIRLLQYANQFDSRTEDIVLYYGVCKAYSTRGLTNIQTYFDTTLACTSDSTDRGIAALTAIPWSAVLLETNDPYDLLMFHYPIQAYSPRYNASVQFIVSVKRIVTVLESYAPNSQLMFRLTVGDDAVYFQVTDGKCTILEEDEFVLLQKTRNQVLQYPLSADGMDLELHFDPRVSWAEIKHFQNINILLLILGIFLSVLISYVLSNHRWGRFQSLADCLTMETYSTGTTKAFPDEFDYLKVILEQSRRESDQMEQNAQIYRHAMMRQAATMIFHGMTSKPEAIRHILNTCGLELFEEYYYLCGIMLNEQDINVRSFENIFDDMLYCDDIINGNMILVFLAESATQDLNCAGRLDMAGKLRRKLLSIGVSCSRLALSQMYDNLSMINYAYLEVISLLENPLQPDGLIECWDNHRLFSSDRLTQCQSEQLKLFIEALEHRNIRDAQISLNCMLGENFSKDNFERQYYIRYCIRQALILAVRGDETEQSSGLMSKIILINPANEMHFHERILKILQTFCDSDKRSEQLDKAVAYVKNNFHRFDLSLEEVAACAGMSKTQMSKLFKAQLGIGYLDFLTKLRMDKAQELLVNTSQSVKSIFLAVGYIDKTSFTRKFKAYYGMSPTEYRCQKQGTTPEDTDGNTEQEGQ